MYGCTAPYGINKNNICQEQHMANGNKGKNFNVNKLYQDMFMYYNDNCDSPCSFLKMKSSLIKERNMRNNNEVKINFKEYIKVTEAYYLYTTLTLIAEVGGYVGLFLGVSVNQVSELLNTMFDILDSKLLYKIELPNIN